MTVMFDIAEGSGEYSAQEKSRFYRMARRSATECASIFDIGQRIRIIEQQRVTSQKVLAKHPVAQRYPGSLAKREAQRC